jgi:hypothetical protein
MKLKLHAIQACTIDGLAGQWRVVDTWFGITRLMNDKGEVIFVNRDGDDSLAGLFAQLFAGVFRGERPNPLEATLVKASPDVIYALQKAGVKAEPTSPPADPGHRDHAMTHALRPLLRVAVLLEDQANSLRDCHTIAGEWDSTDPIDVAAKDDCTELLVLARYVRRLHRHARDRTGNRAVRAPITTEGTP